MATFKPGRLRRVLSRITRADPAFAFYSLPTEAIYDADIQSVTMHRGKAGRGGGYHPSTLEMTARGLLPAALTGDNCRFFLRDLTAADLAAHTGQSAAAIQYRYQGRAGKLAVDDRARKYTSTVYAASWLARHRRAGRVAYPKAGQTLDAFFTDVLALNATQPPAGLNLTFQGPFTETIARDLEALTFRDAEGKLAGAIGLLFRERRDGTTELMSLPYRSANAAALVNQRLPLTRSQAISPAKWEQANEYPAIIFKYKVTDPAGAIVTRTIDVSTEPLRETVEEDWSYLRSATSGTSGNVYMEGYGRAYTMTTRTYSVPSVTVDLLALLDSPKQYHRDQAGQLLAMEVADPLFFSGDWPTPLRGVHFAEGITETITPDAWTLEFSLSRWQHVLGAEVPPAIKPRVWDSATNRWDEATMKWIDA